MGETRGGERTLVGGLAGVKAGGVQAQGWRVAWCGGE